MPLRRVYRLFNEIGVRHLPVVDCREQVIGIITRKDILPEMIEEKVSHYMHHLASKASSDPQVAGVVDAAKSVVRRASRQGTGCMPDVGSRASAAAAAVAAEMELASEQSGARTDLLPTLVRRYGMQNLTAVRIWQDTSSYRALWPRVVGVPTFAKT